MPGIRLGSYTSFTRLLFDSQAAILASLSMWSYSPTSEGSSCVATELA